MFLRVWIKLAIIDAEDMNAMTPVCAGRGYVWREGEGICVEGGGGDMCEILH